MKKLLFNLLFITQSIFSQAQYDFAIYHDGDIGAWEDGIAAFEQFLNWKEVSHNRVTAQDINTVVLADFYEAIYFPGGDADYYNADINANGIQNIQNLISNGGAYIGMCAGAEFACDKLVWQGYTINYPLNLFQGEAVGPIDEIAVWPNYAMTTLSMNPEDATNQFEPENEDILYWGGTVFNAYSGTNVDTVATYDSFFDSPAIIKFTYGNGRVLLISPHPEIEEDNDRDSTDVAQELDDNGSDWNFLWTATDWLLGDTLSTPNSLSIQPQISKSDIIVYPNPVKNKLNINTEQKIKKISIYNQIGQKISIVKQIENTIDFSGLPTGLYIIEVETYNKKHRKKLMKIH